MSYPTKKLGEVCEIVGGGTPSTSVSEYWNGDVVWITPKDMGKLDDVEIFDSSKKITEEGLKKSSAKLLPKGAVILSSRAPIGYVAIAGVPLATNQGCRSFICDKSKIYNRYLLHFLLTQTEHLNMLGSGSTFKEISGSKLKELGIPLPSLAEQKKIVAKLERVLAKISEAKKLRAEAQETASQLLPAELHKIFTTPHHTHPYKLENVGMSSTGKNGWEEKEINDICEHPQYGFTASSTREQAGPKFLRITDIQDGKVNWETVPYCRCSDSDKYKLVKGDIVFARTGATVGKSYLISEVPKEAIYASYLIRLRVKDRVIPEFLYYFFQSPEYWEQITNEQVGMAQPNVNGSKLAKIKIPLPPLAEQKKIVARLDSLSEKLKKLQGYQKSTQSDLSTLEQAILQKAFS